MSFSIGPIAFPFQPFWLLLSYWLAIWLAAKWAGAERAQAAKDLAQSTLWAGLIASRFVYLALHATLYMDNPWAVIDIRDGGWHAPSGVVAMVVWLVWRLRHQTQIRQAMWRATAVGVGVWWAGSIWADQQIVADMPAVPLTELQQGQTQALNSLLDGRPVVVNLWATWCGPCRYEMPALSQAQQDNPHIRFVFVNQGEASDHVQNFITQQGWRLSDVWLDAKAQTGQAVGSNSLPATLFYDAQGRLLKAHMGVLTPIAIRAQLSHMNHP